MKSISAAIIVAAGMAAVAAGEIFVGPRAHDYTVVLGSVIVVCGMLGWIWALRRNDP